MNSITANAPNMRSMERIMITRRIVVESDCDTIQAKLVDLSPNGIGVMSNSSFDHQKIYRLFFSLPGFDTENTIHIAAQPIHATEVHNGYLIGFQFIEPSAHALLVIREFYNFHRRFQA